ncbi:MAG: AtpZ/AtpI family protein [Alphaproteobacteria bacterium]|nr:AtpZ/AtpI family protein [Alphaproteobacteria bacterium]
MAKIGEDDRDSPLHDFSDRLADARHRKDKATPRAAPKEGLGPAMRVGVELVAALGVGVAIGWSLDRWLGTAPWMMVVFFVLGAAAGVMNVYRYMGGMDAAPGWRRHRPSQNEEEG